MGYLNARFCQSRLSQDSQQSFNFKITVKLAEATWQNLHFYLHHPSRRPKENSTTTTIFGQQLGRTDGNDMAIEEAHPDWIAGVVFCLFGGFFTNLGINLQKFSVKNHVDSTI